jgi:ferric-dicitrate binding protein FerR (iron transport regulator)
MTQPDEQRAAGEAPQSDEALERLLRLAGPRQTVDAERARRVRDTVHEAWRTSVRRRDRVRYLSIGGAGLVAAAGIFFAVSTGRRDAGSAPSRLPAAPAPPAARLVAATGGTVAVIATGATAAPDSTRGAPGRVSVGDAVAIGAALETGDGVMAALALADGGDVRLNQRTALRLTDARELRIDRGAVYIDSGNGGAAVIVRTPVGVVRDVGTQFEVGLANGVWRVRVRAGSIRYDRGEAQHAAAAGSELLVHPDGSLVTRPAPTYGADWDWVVRAGPAFRVEGQTLAAFLDWVSRESGRRIEFADARLRRETILHGSIDGLTAEEALGVILPACGLTHRVDAQRVIISRAEGSR